MCLWTRLRLNISKKLKSRVLVFLFIALPFQWCLPRDLQHVTAGVSGLPGSEL